MPTIIMRFISYELKPAEAYAIYNVLMEVHMIFQALAGKTSA
jgi:hypothetical protein